LHGFGIVGTGVIAATHATVIRLLPNASLIAVTDADAESAVRFAASHDCAAEPDLARLLARDDIDVVVVCVPSGLHADIGVAAARAGKHLVVEKPVDVRLTAADRLISAAEAAGVRLTVISQHRFDPGVVELRSLVSAGRLGKLLLGEAVTKWHRTQAYYDSSAWRGTWALDGGSLLNQGIHYVDLLLAVMGPVAEVTAVAATQGHRMEAEDTALALLRFSSGALGTLASSTCVYPGFPQRLEVSGTGGTAIVLDGQLTHCALTDDAAQPAGPAATPAATAAADPAALDLAGHAAQVADLLAAIDEGREPVITGADGRAVLEVVLAVYQSAREGRAVTLPLRSGSD
jgi:UDP-N-acetyl-2-amino-2-deoxyglucuronate dehydrogenase